MNQDQRKSLSEGHLLAGERFRIEGQLGVSGGFGITYRALDTRLNRTVAIKEFFPTGCLRSPDGPIPDAQFPPDDAQWTQKKIAETRARFLDEGKRLANLDHLHIVPVYDHFEENGFAYLVMKFLVGQTLAGYAAAQGGPLTVAEALRAAREIGSALVLVHDKGDLHRDVTPRNVMRLRTGGFVLIDFGAARQFVQDRSLPQTCIFSEGFAAPEQYHERASRGAYTDVYGLCATLYWMLTGEPPVGATIRLAEDHQPAVKVLRPEVPSWLSEVVMRGMHPKANRRYKTAVEMMQALEAAMGSDPPRQPAPVRQALPQSEQWVKSPLASPSADCPVDAPSPVRGGAKPKTPYQSWLRRAVLVVCLAVLATVGSYALFRKGSEMFPFGSTSHGAKLLPDRSTSPIPNKITSHSSVQPITAHKVIRTEIVPFKHVRLPSAALIRGSEQTKHAGHSGIREVVEEIKEKNGKEFDRKVISTSLRRSSVDSLIFFGTRPVPSAGAAIARHNLSRNLVHQPGPSPLPVTKPRASSRTDPAGSTISRSSTTQSGRSGAPPVKQESVECPNCHRHVHKGAFCTYCQSPLQ